MYTKTKAISSRGLHAAADYFFHNFVSQPKAVQNRLKIVENLLESQFRRLAATGAPMRALNLGGGSSRAVIQTLARLSATQPLQLSVTTIDKDISALDLGRKLAAEYGVSSYFQWVEGNVKNLSSLIAPQSVELVEMVGLLDYFNLETAASLLSNIQRVMVPGGVFVTANVTPNSEVRFVRNVGWPQMHYKTEDELRSLLRTAGFDLGTLQCFQEPMGVHLVCLIKK
ncbi:MAG: methyltransferase domain-containing protein [Patescibacteria group bacterium]|nr:methyltransferase domain-containing protein [Patescibacteria group bacterium]